MDTRERGMRVIPMPTDSTLYHRRFDSRKACAIGSLEIILGVGMIACGCVSILYHAGLYYVGHGIWCGLMIILAGAFGISAAKRRTTCVINSSLVLNVLASINGGIAFFLALWAAINNDTSEHYYLCPVNLIINIVLLLLSFTAGILSIVQSTFSCKITCCCVNSSEGLLSISTIQHQALLEDRGSMHSLPPMMEPTTAYIYQDGGMIPITIFTPVSQPAPVSPPPTPSVSASGEHDDGFTNPWYKSYSQAELLNSFASSRPASNIVTMHIEQPPPYQSLEVCDSAHDRRNL